MHMYLASYTLIVGIGHIVRAHTVYYRLAEVTTMLVQLWFTTHAQHLTSQTIAQVLLPRIWCTSTRTVTKQRERERERERERGGDTPFTMYVHVHVHV